MRRVEILVDTEKAGPDVFGVGFVTLGAGVGVGVVRNRVRLRGIRI